MTPKQQRFCEEYLIDLNATQAAIRAGYSARTANRTGHKLLSKTDIAAKITELQAGRSEATEIDAKWVLLRLAKIADFDIRKLFDTQGRIVPIDQLDDDTAFALAGLDVDENFYEDGTRVVSKKFKTVDKKAALELIAKHLGMFVDRLETTDTTPKVTFIIPDNGRD